jgi:hypothetical protein
MGSVHDRNESSQNKTKQKRKSILMAIAINPHTYTGILFDSPWLKVMQFLVAVTILILWFWFICIFPSLHENILVLVAAFDVVESCAMYCC